MSKGQEDLRHLPGRVLRLGARRPASPSTTALGWRICWLPCSCGEEYYPDKARATRPLASHEYRPGHAGFRPRSPKTDAADTTEYDYTAYDATSFQKSAATVSVPAHAVTAHAADYATASLTAG